MQGQVDSDFSEVMEGQVDSSFSELMQGQVDSDFNEVCCWCYKTVINPFMWKNAS